MTQKKLTPEEQAQALYEEGHRDGYEVGYQEGYEVGYRDGSLDTQKVLTER